MLKSAFTDAAAVIGTAFRLLWRHWPPLFALFLAGYAAHELVMRGAVKASAAHGVLGFLVLLLAPIATLSAFVLMLRTVRPSLPWLSAATSPGEPGARQLGLLDHAGSVLIPFLTVYASYGYFKEDTSEYAYRVWEDEALNNAAIFSGGQIDVMSRLPFDIGPALIVVLCVSVALRWALGRWDGTARYPWLGLPAAYVEVVWIGFATLAVVGISSTARGWAEGRRVVRWLYDLWYDVSGVLGPLADPFRDASSWLWALVIDSANAVIVIPIAWLVVGAVVYGHRIAPEPKPASELYRQAVDRWSAVPKPVSRLGAEVAAVLSGRFGMLVYGLRLLFRAGLVPMLLFCLAFVVADGATAWLWELERFLIGPRELGVVWMPLSGPLGMLNDAVGWVLLACLLAAAIDRVLRRERAGEPVPAPRVAPEAVTEVATDAYPEVVSRA